MSLGPNRYLRWGFPSTSLVHARQSSPAPTGFLCYGLAKPSVHKGEVSNNQRKKVKKIHKHPITHTPRHTHTLSPLRHSASISKGKETEILAGYFCSFVSKNIRVNNVERFCRGDRRGHDIKLQLMLHPDETQKR